MKLSATGRLPDVPTCDVGICQLQTESKYPVVGPGHEVIYARKTIDALSRRPNNSVLLLTRLDRGLRDVFGLRADCRRRLDDVAKANFQRFEVIALCRENPRNEAFLA